MRSFTGRGGQLYLTSDPVSFDGLPLEDCGDGFDWRAAEPTMRHWLDNVPVRFETWEGGAWRTVEPREVAAPVGRVGFNRCLRGQHVRASGACRPLSFLCSSGTWDLLVKVVTQETSELDGSERQRFASVTAGSVARLTGCDGHGSARPGARVLLPSGAGAFVGTGSFSVAGTIVTFNFDERGVCYGAA